MSFGAPDVTAKWVENQKFPYEIWTDSDRALATAFRAVSSPEQRYPDRITVVLDAEGKVVLEYRSVNVLTSPQDVLDDVKKRFR